mgnify:CR=1 FL=1
MKFQIPEVKIGLVAVSRDCFPVSLSEERREKIANLLPEVYNCKTVVENEDHVKVIVEDLKKNKCNALAVFLGNFGPETPETLLCKYFDGPVMILAAAEDSQSQLVYNRGDAYCGMLNCSYNLGLRNLTAYIPEYPVGTAEEIANKIKEFYPIARTLIGISSLKIISFGPRPQDFYACNAPIKPLYDFGVEVQENSELDLLIEYKKHADDNRIGKIVKEMEEELGDGNTYPDLLPKIAQYELTLLDYAKNNKGVKDYVVFANKCWPAFPQEFGFEPCYVHSRLASRGIPVACEVDIYGAFSEFIGACVTASPVTILDINNTVPKDMYISQIENKYPYSFSDVFMGFHCGNTPISKLNCGKLSFK